MKPKNSSGKSSGKSKKAIVQSRAEKALNKADNALITKAKQYEFLECFSGCGSLLQAAESAAVHRNSHYHWLADQDYRRAFMEAKLKAIDALESRVFQRANVDSDRLAEFLLKGLKPDVYGDRMKSELSGPGGAPIDIRNQRLESLSDDELVIVMGLQRKISGDA